MYIINLFLNEFHNLRFFQISNFRWISQFALCNDQSVFAMYVFHNSRFFPISNFRGASSKGSKGPSPPPSNMPVRSIYFCNVFQNLRFFSNFKFSMNFTICTLPMINLFFYAQIFDEFHNLVGVMMQLKVSYYTVLQYLKTVLGHLTNRKLIVV